MGSGKMVKVVSARQPSALTVAKRANRKANRALKLFEDKYFDVNTAPAAVDWNGTLSVLNPVTQGDGVSNRDGDELAMKSVWFQAQMTIAAGLASSTMRVILLYDKAQTIGAVNQILSVVGTASTVTSAYNFEYRNNYIVLYDKTFIIDTINRATWQINKRIRLNKKTVFQGGGSSTIRTGGLRLLLISNQTAGVTTPAALTNSRLFFTD